MQEFDYTLPSSKSVDEAAAAVTAKTAEKGYRVLAVHDVQATLAEKGFEREPMLIIEVCNARHAHAVLERDPKIALMLPCPIVVYGRDGETFISTIRPGIIAAFYPNAEAGELAAEVERTVFAIVDEAR